MSVIAIVGGLQLRPLSAAPKGSLMREGAPIVARRSTRGSPAPRSRRRRRRPPRRLLRRRLAADRASVWPVGRATVAAGGRLRCWRLGRPRPAVAVAVSARSRGWLPSNRVSGLAHLPHRLVEGVAQLALEAGRHLLELAVELAELAHGLGQLLRPEHDERDEQQEDDLAALTVEHAGESTS